VWVAISVEDDAGWVALCEELGEGGKLANDPRFATAADRLANADELDAALGELTAGRAAEELEARLQERGVAAHRVLDSSGCWADPQLAARGHFVEVGDESERTVVESCRSMLSRTPASVRPGRPTLGRDSNEILEGVLGYDGERIVELVIAEVLG